MLFTKLQMMHILANLLVALIGIGLTFLAIKLTKLKDAQSRLIFILYMIYWIPTLMCRDYTGLMAEHSRSEIAGILVFIPLLCYGLVGLVWRPLIDFLSFKMKSRRNIIFIALGLQLLTFIPYVIYPTFATNIVQSIGCGIGASCIGLFNLMFDDRQQKKTVFATVSILAIPPILAQLFASSAESLVACMVPAVYTHDEYVNIVLWLWMFSIILIVVCFVIAAFIKPRPKLLFIAKKQKTVIQNKHSWWAYILLCLGAFFVVFVRWTTAGPTTGLQLTYISAHFGKDTKYYEGYTGLVYTAGQLIGTIIAGYALNNPKHDENKLRTTLISSSCIVGIIYCILAGFFVNVGAFIGLLAIIGLSYGLIYPVIIGIAVKKVFVKVRHFTPVGLLNTFLALGISFGIFIVSYFKGAVFEQIHGFSTYSFNDFRLANWHIMLVNIVMIVLVAVCYTASYYIYKKHPEKKVTLKNAANMMGDTEM